MSEADKMFDELGYEKSLIINKFEHLIIYENRPFRIIFDLDEKCFSKTTVELSNEAKYIDILELQAINEKVKELGWYE